MLLSRRGLHKQGALSRDEALRKFKVHQGLSCTELKPAAEEDRCFEVVSVSATSHFPSDRHRFTIDVYGNGKSDAMSAVVREVDQPPTDRLDNFLSFTNLIARRFNSWSPMDTYICSTGII